MREFDVIEKCEHYFRCLVNGMHCRIIIDDYSQNLPIGRIQLHVEEITDLYQHHAKDAVFQLTLPLEQQDSIDICTLNAGKKNRFTYRACVRLGGKWEPILNEWVFSASVENKVNQLRQIIHSKPVNVEVTFQETLTEVANKLTLFGFELVKGARVNHTPILHRGINLKRGTISHIPEQNRKTIVQAGSVVRLSIPQLMLDNELFKENYLSAVHYKVVR